MRKYCLHRLTWFLLLILCITSCNEPGGNSRKLSGKDIPATYSKIIKTQGSDKYDNTHCSLMDKEGNLWFGTTGEGVYCYDGKSFVNFTEKEGLSNNNVLSIIEDKAGNIWFGTSSGVCRYHGKSFTSFDFPATSVDALLQDKAGNIWLATDDHGVYRYDGKALNNFLYDYNTGYNNTHNFQIIQCMFEDKRGNIWFGSWNNGGVFRYDGTSFTHFTTDDGFCDNMVSGILEDKAGNILFATRDYGVCSYDGKSFASFSGKAGFPNNNIRCILEDTKGNIWLGTDGKMDNNGTGVYRYDGKSFTNFTTKDGLSDNNVFTILEDRAGNIWFGTRNTGLCRYDGKSFTDFSEH